MLCVGPTGCSDVYPIGGARTDAGSDGPGVCCEGRFELPLDTAGTAAFGDRALGATPPLLLLHGEDARADGWSARVGGRFVSAGPSELARRGPFVDATRGVRGSYLGSLTTPESVVIELVLAAPLASSPASSELLSAPVSITIDGGALVVGDTTIETLAPGAWYHLVITRSFAGTEVFVNGRSTATLPGASAAFEGSLEVGGEATIAWLALSSTTPSSTTPTPTPLDVSTRFAALTGTLAGTAGGLATPLELTRESDAYVDLVQDGARRLHRVGPRWPRIACRPDAPADRSDALTADVVCGYLAENESSVETLALAARAPVGLSVVAVEESGPGEAIAVERLDAEGDGERHVTLPLAGDDDQVLSLFVRRAAVDVGLELDLGTRGRAVFSLDATPTVEGTLRAHDEPWGDDWHRVWVVTEAVGEAGATLWVLREGARSFAASGPLLFVAGTRAEGNRRDPSSLGPRARDGLAYATEGNVPVGRGTISAQVLVDPWTRLHDGTNVHFASAPQVVNLYYSLDTRVTFAATGGPFFWNLHGDSIRDGRVIEVEASWSAGGVALRTRETTDEDALAAGLDAATTFERFVVGAGGPSGELHGLVSNLRIE